MKKKKIPVTFTGDCADLHLSNKYRVLAAVEQQKSSLQKFMQGEVVYLAFISFAFIGRVYD